VPAPRLSHPQARAVRGAQHIGAPQAQAENAGGALRTCDAREKGASEGGGSACMAHPTMLGGRRMLTDLLGRGECLVEEKTRFSGNCSLPAILSARRLAYDGQAAGVRSCALSSARQLSDDASSSVCCPQDTAGYCRSCRQALMKGLKGLANFWDRGGGDGRTHAC